jgi:hypothetical protein
LTLDALLPGPELNSMRVSHCDPRGMILVGRYVVGRYLWVDTVGDPCGQIRVVGTKKGGGR